MENRYWEKLYHIACVIILACIALLTISIASVALQTKEEVQTIRLILQNDYEITQ